MAYQNVNTPRFFINDPLFMIRRGHPLASSSDRKLSASIFEMIPSRKNKVPGYYHTITPPQLSGYYNYIAYLGHNFQSTGQTTYIHSSDEEQIDDGTEFINYIENSSIQYDGFSIHIFPKRLGSPTISFNQTGVDVNVASVASLGCISLGNTFTMTRNPNLSLKMSREYGGTKETTSYIGSSISNTMWNSAPRWGSGLGAWELGSGNPAFSSSGRRIWDLSFSYMDDQDLWGPNQLLSNTFISTAYSGEYNTDDLELVGIAQFQNNLLTDYNFFSQVWHKTLGGTLPFIFQPDSTNNNPDQFAICQFKNDSLKAEQSALNVYDISLTIEEVW